MKPISVEDFQDNEEEELEPTEVTETAVAPTKPILTREKELEIFKALAYKSFKDVGYDFGLHFYYDTDVKIRTAVLGIARKIRKAPELYGISQDAVEVIDEAVASRSIKNNPGMQSEINILNESFRDKLEVMRDNVAEMLRRKLEKAMKKKNGEDEFTIKELRELLAMAIDKSRLLRGESTENITKISKVDTDNISPEGALKLIMKARDAMIENNTA